MTKKENLVLLHRTQTIEGLFTAKIQNALCSPTFFKFSPLVVCLLTRGAWGQGRRVASMGSFPPEPDYPPFRHHEVRHDVGRHDVGTLSKDEEALSLNVRSSDFNPVATLLTVAPPPSLAAGHPVPAPGSAHLQQPHYAGDATGSKVPEMVLRDTQNRAERGDALIDITIVSAEHLPKMVCVSHRCILIISLILRFQVLVCCPVLVYAGVWPSLRDTHQIVNTTSSMCRMCLDLSMPLSRVLSTERRTRQASRKTRFRLCGKRPLPCRSPKKKVSVSLI